MARRRTIIDSNAVPAAPELNEAGFHPSDIEIVSEDRGAKKAKEAKFMNEVVEIEIEPGTQDNDPMYIPLGHNGITQYVKRGEPIAVKRKFLYSGLMAKLIRMNCDFRRGPGDTEVNKLTPSTKLGYQIHLIRDDNTREGGMRWFQRVMAESTGVRV